MWASIRAHFGVFVIIWVVGFICGQSGSFVGGRVRYLGNQGFSLTLGVSPHCVVVLSGCGHVVSVSFSVMFVIVWSHHLLVGQAW